MSDREQQYQNQIREPEQQIRLLKEQVDFLACKLYGTKSEKGESANADSSDFVRE